MAYLTVNNVQLRAISACVPKNKESNHDYDWISEKERALLIKTTGIEFRHIAPKHITTSDMCFASAEALINDLEIDRNDIEILLFVSQSPDYFLPATSIILQHRLGLNKATMAFDIQLGCSGYVYGLSVISNLMSNGKFKKGLLLVGDKSSFSPSKQDKSTYPIFGDAGTATLLEYDPAAEKMDFNLQSDGSGANAIMIQDGGMRNSYTDKSDEMVEVGPGIIRNRKNLMLDGIEVFNFSLREATPNVTDLLAYNATEIKDYDFFIFHQANKLMNESIRKKLKIEPGKVPYSLQNYGNTSSASIPLTIVTELPDKMQDKKLSILLSAFGVGLSWASASLTVTNLKCLPLIEIE
ncbi:MAG: ketoacyl-ACP synthase [Bacteroidetes bacterium]|jgi:3-oxoacyl-[acyl-carrier-protein] synthase-3|nr:ketoacyl-ACP synthase [Bacteroidota bacterium]